MASRRVATFCLLQLLNHLQFWNSSKTTAAPHYIWDLNFPKYGWWGLNRLVLLFWTKLLNLIKNTCLRASEGAGWSGINNFAVLTSPSQLSPTLTYSYIQGCWKATCIPFNLFAIAHNNFDAVNGNVFYWPRQILLNYVTFKICGGQLPKILKNGNSNHPYQNGDTER